MQHLRQVCGLAAKGLRGQRLKMDVTISDGHRQPAYVINFVEAKFLLSGKDHLEAVGQIEVGPEAAVSHAHLRRC